MLEDTARGTGATTTGHPVVLQIVPSLVTGGAERGAIDIAIAVNLAGGTSLIASEGGPMEYELKRATVTHIKLPLASKNPFVVYRNAGRLARLILAHKVDIVHARSRAPAWSAAAAAKRTGCHFVTTFHGIYNFGNKVKHRYNAIMTKGEFVIANSEYTFKHVLDNYKVDPHRVRLVRRGIDLILFDPERVSAERVIQLAKRWRLPDGVPVIMLPGRLTRLMGHLVLIEALGHLHELEYCCVLVGSAQGRGAYRAEVERAIARHGVEDRVYLADHCDDMPAAYVLADLVISASTDPESFGRVISEAQGMGCPVIASDHGGSREQVLADRTGVLVKPGDPIALAEAIRTALAFDAQARERLAQEARVRALRYFSKEEMCANTLDLYRELLRAQVFSASGTGQAAPAPADRLGGS